MDLIPNYFYLLEELKLFPHTEPHVETAYMFYKDIVIDFGILKSTMLILKRSKAQILEV